MIVIDTDIAIDVLRRFPPALAWSASQAAEVFVLSGFSALELFAGSHDAKQQSGVDSMIGDFKLIWPSAPYCEQALQTYRSVHLAHGIGAIDVLVAYTAIELGLPLHTFNVKHFKQVPRLVTVQPYSK